jgi:predicted phosphodiesterase
MRVQYFSDIHLEFKNIDIIPKLLKNVNADVLVMAGDICPVNDEESRNKFKTLLEYVCKRYKYVMHVAGNHEYYTEKNQEEIKNNTITHVNAKFKAYSKQFTNYIYMDCNTLTLLINEKPYTFIGATLWTKVNKADWPAIQDRMNDYNSIYVLNKGQISPFTVSYMQLLHTKHRNYIKKEINKPFNKIPIILITHHRPFIPEGIHASIFDQAYTSDMSDVIKLPVVASISGHCHQYTKIEMGGIQYLTNPKGYPGQHCGYRNDAYIDL